MGLLDVICAQIQNADELMVQLGLLYSLGHSRAPLFLLDLIGALLELPRSPGWTQGQYLTLLRARIRSRRSYGTYDDVKAIANLLRKPGTFDEATVSILHPEALQVTIPNIGPGIEAARTLLLGAIQETTRLDLVTKGDSGGGDGAYLTLSVPSLGLGKKLAKSL